MKKLMCLIGLIVLLVTGQAFGTITNETVRNDYTGNGSTTTFAFEFIIYSQSDLDVYVDGTQKTVDIHYTIAASGVNNSSGGSVVFGASYIPASAEAVALVSGKPYTQQTSLSSRDSTYETTYDKNVMLSKQLKEITGRGLTLSPYSTYSGLTLPDPQAGYFLVWNDALTGLENSAGSGGSGVALGTAAVRDAEDTLTDGDNLPDGAAIKAYGDTNWGSGAPLFSAIATGTNTTATMTVGTGGTLTYSGSGIVNATRFLGVTTVSAAEFGYVNGVTSALQTQLGAKQALHANLTDIAAITGVQGDVLYYDGSDWVALGFGASGKYLKTQGTGANPIWDTPAGAGDLLADGSVPLTANWDVGAYTITGTQFISDIAIGTAPFVVTSTTEVTNLNAATATLATTATVATTVTITDNESTNENNPVVFVAGADPDGGDLGLETDGTMYYDPSTGTLNTTVFTATGNVAGATYGSNASISDAELLTIDDGATTEIAVGGGAGSAMVWTTATGTGAPARAGSPTFTTNITTPQITLTGSDASPDATSEIRYDTVVAGLAGGSLVWYDNDELRYLVDLETLPSDDAYVVAYSAANDNYYMKADSVGGFDSTTIDSTTWSDGANAANTWTFDVSGTNHTQIAGNATMDFSHTVTIGTAVSPDAADGATIGTATKEWSDLYLAASGVIYGENDQSNTLTSSATGWTANLNLAAATYGSDGSIPDATLLGIDDGATTEILVGGGAGVIPVWTTATGTGAPVRAGSPTFTTKATTPKLVLTAADASPAAAGEVTYDNVIAGLSGGGLRFYDDDSVRLLLDLETDPVDGDDDKVVAWDKDADGWYLKAEAAATSWIGLSDTDPANFAGSGGKFVQVNATPDALEFGNLSEDATGDVTLGAGGDVNHKLTFDANTNDGVIQWLEDEDYFQGNVNVFNAAMYSGTDTQKIQAAIDAAATNGGGTVYIPAGTWNVADDDADDDIFDVNVTMTIVGDGNRSTVITTAGTDDHIFNVAVTDDKGVAFRDLRMDCSGTATAGAGIYLNDTHYSIIDNVWIVGTYIGLHSYETNHFFLTDSYIANAILYGVKIENSIADSGDSKIDNTVIAGVSPAVNTGAAIYQTSSGGLLVSNSKLNKYNVGYHLDTAVTGTSITILSGNSIEGQYIGAGSWGILLETTGSGTWHQIVITGNQVWNGIKLNPTDDDDILATTITGNSIHGRNNQAGIKIVKGDGVIISGNAFRDYGSPFAIDNDSTGNYVVVGANAYYNYPASEYYSGISDKVVFPTHMEVVSSSGDANLTVDAPALSDAYVNLQYANDTKSYWKYNYDAGTPDTRFSHTGTLYWKNDGTDATTMSLSSAGALAGITTLNTGQGAYELYGLERDLLGDSTITITNGGDNVLYGSDINITIAVTANSIGDTQLANNTTNTGENALTTTGDPQFASLSLTGDIIMGQNDPSIFMYDVNHTDDARIITDYGDWRVDHYIGTSYQETTLRLDLDTGNFSVLGAIASGAGVCCAGDYVFKKDYDLKSLDDLQAFVDTESHLPGMTINQSMDKGLNLTTGIGELLIKVEEQALYILQLHDRLAALEAKVNFVPSGMEDLWSMTDVVTH